MFDLHVPPVYMKTYFVHINNTVLMYAICSNKHNITRQVAVNVKIGYTRWLPLCFYILKQLHLF